MFGKVLLWLLTASVVVFLIGVLGCMFWLGIAALSLFVKIMFPIIFVILVLGLIAGMTNLL